MQLRLRHRLNAGLIMLHIIRKRTGFDVVVDRAEVLALRDPALIGSDRIDGRIKDIIIRGGENVPARSWCYVPDKRWIWQAYRPSWRSTGLRNNIGPSASRSSTICRRPRRAKFGKYQLREIAKAFAETPRKANA
jgi:hypothetical protein